MFFSSKEDKTYFRIIVKTHYLKCVRVSLGFSLRNSCSISIAVTPPTPEIDSNSCFIKETLLRFWNISFTFTSTIDRQHVTKTTWTNHWTHNIIWKYICDDLHCMIWYHLYNLKNAKKAHWGVLLLNKSDTPPWAFFTFFELCKWYQIAERITKVNVISLNIIWTSYVHPINLRICGATNMIL